MNCFSNRLFCFNTFSRQPNCGFVFLCLALSLSVPTGKAQVPASSPISTPVLPSTSPPPSPTQSPLTSLPATVTDIFARANVPLESVSIIVKEIGAREPIISHNPTKPMNPASVMKLFTTYAGLELLGSAYTWKTEIYAVGEVRGGTLKGDLVLKGMGDPKLTTERFWFLLKQLRDRGLTTIKGDLILDKTFFDPINFDPAKFDGEPLKAYNVGADALLLNFKTVRFNFAPSLDNKSVLISPDLKPVQMEIVNQMRLNDAPCGDWRDHILLDVQTVSPTQSKVSFAGNYPRSCGERGWSISLLDHARFVGGAFASMWKEMGGKWDGAVKIQAAPLTATLLTATESPPLAEIVRDINKFSNNTMARQLFLTISAEKMLPPANAGRSADIIKEWLNKKGIAAPELVFENGSGLSRIERASAATLSAMLEAAFRSSVMPEFISSLPLLGVDGTLRRRGRSDAIAGQAHIKGGTLNDSRAMAGYVLDQNSRRWVVVAARPGLKRRCSWLLRTCPRAATSARISRSSGSGSNVLTESAHLAQRTL